MEPKRIEPNNMDLNTELKILQELEAYKMPVFGIFLECQEYTIDRMPIKVSLTDDPNGHRKLLRQPEEESFYCSFINPDYTRYFKRILPFKNFSGDVLFVKSGVESYISQNPEHGNFVVDFC